MVVSGAWASMGGYDIHVLSNKGEKPTEKNKICWLMVIGEVCGC